MTSPGESAHADLDSAWVLPPPAEREAVHTRSILCRSFRRADGLFDVDGRFIDSRPFDYHSPFRGDCPAGGLRVTGYVTPAARYCAITGGRYSVTAASGTADEKGTCTLPGGKICDAAAYYGATCSRERP